MKKLYQSEDGKLFESELDCLDHEGCELLSRKIDSLLSKNTSYSTLKKSIIRGFVESNAEALREILSSVVPSPNWEYSDTYPWHSVGGSTPCEVMFRDGSTFLGTVRDFPSPHFLVQGPKMVIFHRLLPNRTRMDTSCETTVKEEPKDSSAEKPRRSNFFGEQDPKPVVFRKNLAKP